MGSREDDRDKVIRSRLAYLRDLVWTVAGFLAGGLVIAIAYFEFIA